jgi:hypothetical protein
MDIHSLFNLKGGVGKSTLTPILAAAIKVIFPDLTVGVIAADSANGTLAKMYARDLEAQDQGLWNIINVMFSRRTQGRMDLLEEAIHAAVRPLTVVPGQSNVASRQADFEAAAKALGVNPSAPLQERQIQFIGTAQFMGAETRSMPLLNQLDSHNTVGVPLLQTIQQVLGWDVCFLDLPGEAGDTLVRILTPWCTCVVIPSDVYKPANLTMEADVLTTLEALNVKPAGFLANKASGTAASNRAVLELEGIANRAGLNILGTIRSLPTLASANSAYDIHGREFVPQDPDWRHPEEGWFVGLHRAALDFHANESIRSATTTAIKEVEKVAMAMIRTTPSLNARLSVEV